jgi:hypothetical protein
MKRSKLALVILALCCMPSVATAAPTCFTTPLPNVAPSKTGNADPACEVLAKVLETAGGPDTSWVPGQIVNAALKLSEGGFGTDTFVLQFHVTPAFSATFTVGGDELVRLSSSDAVARTGSWWVPKEFVTDSTGRWLPASRIAELLALPQGSVLNIVAYSGAIDVGTFGYVGIAAPAFNHRGGSIQFWFPREPVYTKDTSEPAGTAK